MPKRVVVGVVTSDKMAKTRRVEIDRLVRHPKYGKFVRRRTVCTVHDEGNASTLGDLVEIVESPPRSKTKRWELVKVISHGEDVELAARRQQRESRDAEDEAHEIEAAGKGKGAGEIEGGEA